MIPQETWLERILDLKRKHPEMEIKFCADSEDMYQDGWTPHRIAEISICPWYEHEYRIYTDEDEIKELLSGLYDSNMVEMIYEKIKKVICVLTVSE